MEDYLKEKLGVKVLKSANTVSGCINKANVYESERGKIFVKCNSGPEASIMFEGEYASLKELRKTKFIKLPEPLLVGKFGKFHLIAMEFINFGCLRKYNSQLGESLAQLHLHNIYALNSENDANFVGTEKSFVDKFGFNVPTSCGYLPQNNTWSDDWINFYTRQKLQYQIDMILKNTGNREISELWSHLQLKIPVFFKDIDIKPSLLHGDLWCGNAGETDNEPVIFDPASFYGHHEYDLAIAVMFGGFSKDFFCSYHKLIPQEDGFMKRQELYLLFHHLNHWNHFGTHKNSSLQIMKSLIK